MESSPESSAQAQETKKVRVWVDGCYDVGHFGHANSFRQAKALGDVLVVGTHADDVIGAHKGLPLFTQEERVEMIKAIKWVDEVLMDIPYITTVTCLDEHGCDFCAHGDDISTDADGNDTYQGIRDAGRYKEFHRTRGVSTTDIIRRLLRAGEGFRDMLDENENLISSPWTGKSGYLLTANKIKQFQTSTKDITKCERVIYVCGSFDVFHPGHIRFLKAAHEQGDYLLVGVHDDETVRAYKGEVYPILKLTERLMSVLSCKYVDDVVIGAPYTVTRELMDEFQVAMVYHGKQEVHRDPVTGNDPYLVPKELNRFHILDSQSDLTLEDIVNRVSERREELQQRNLKKEKKERQITDQMKIEKKKEEAL